MEVLQPRDDFRSLQSLKLSLGDGVQRSGGHRSANDAHWKMCDKYQPDRTNTLDGGCAVDQKAATHTFALCIDLSALGWLSLCLVRLSRRDQ